MSQKNLVTPILLLAVIIIAVVTIPVQQQHMQVARAITSAVVAASSSSTSSATATSTTTTTANNPTKIFNLVFHGKTFPIKYQITGTGNKLNSMTVKVDKTALIANIVSPSNRKQIIELPKVLPDSKIQEQLLMYRIWSLKIAYTNQLKK
jgi:hypothetical protein